MTKPSALKSVLGAALVVAAFISLLALGTWQVQRLVWKTELIAAIDRGLNTPAVVLDDIATYPEYSRVVTTGFFDHEQEQYLHAINKNGQPGFHVYAPLLRAGQKTVLVNRGFVPPQFLDSATRQEGLLAGEVTLTGVLRKSVVKKYFIPENNVDSNRWFYADLIAMAQAMGFDSADVSPMFLVVEESPNPDAMPMVPMMPMGGVTRVNLPNNHLGYAVTWYGLALALLVVVYVYRRKQRPKPTEEK